MLSVVKTVSSAHETIHDVEFIRLAVMFAVSLNWASINQKFVVVVFVGEQAARNADGSYLVKTSSNLLDCERQWQIVGHAFFL